MEHVFQGDKAKVQCQTCKPFTFPKVNLMKWHMKLPWSECFTPWWYLLLSEKVINSIPFNFHVTPPLMINYLGENQKPC